MVHPIMTELGHDNSSNDHRDEHDDRAGQEHRFAAYFVDDEHSRHSTDQKDDSGDPGGKQSLRAASQAQADKDVRSVVYDGVDTAPLLEKHDQPSGSDALEVIPGAYDVVVLRKLARPYAVVFLGTKTRELSLESASLEETFGFDLQILDSNELVIDWKLPKPDECAKGFIITPLFNQPSR